MEEALRAALLADAGVAALVGTRAYWRERAQTSPTPAIVLHNITGRPDYTMEGRSGLTSYLVQVNCVGDTTDDALALRRAVEAVVDTLRAAPLQALIERTYDLPTPSDGGAQQLPVTKTSCLDLRVWRTEP